MGYTHYWTEKKKPDAIPAQAISIIKEILQDAYKKKIVQFESNNPEPPIVTQEEVRFNGVEENGHETFCYSVKDNFLLNTDEHFSFCKTAQKPYDTIVMKVLIVLKWAFGDDFKLSSDGSFNDEWSDVREEMERKYKIPTGIKRKLTIR